MADYVVSTWDEFLQYNDSANTVKFANPHEVNGEIVLEGNGTQNNPYIVSTYEEMLFATGATYIWQVKLINREQKIYKYNDIYCHYDDSLSTIDFNDIQPNGYNTSLNVNAAVNGNGWTWKNIVLYENGEIDFANATASTQLIISNLYCTSTNQCMKVKGGLRNSILDIFCESLSQLDVFASYVNGGSTCENMSINIKARGGLVHLNSSEYYYIVLKNCRLNLDVDTTGFNIGYFSSWSYGCALNNVVVTGDIKTSGTDDVQLGRSIKGCIYDVSYSGNGKLMIFNNSIVKTASFYNSDKVEDETGLAVTNMHGATTEELKSAQYLFDNGLPIGVV